MRTTDNINLIWQHTPTDYRLALQGAKCIMYGGGKMGAISDMSDTDFQEHLGRAKRAQCRVTRDQALTPILQKYGALQTFNQGTMQNRDNERDTIAYIQHLVTQTTPHKDQQTKEDIELAIKKLNITYPESL